MKIKVREMKPVWTLYTIDKIVVRTEYGSQSTDWTLQFFAQGELIHKEDVRDIDDGIKEACKYLPKKS